MEAQLSLKAALPLTDRIVKASDGYSYTRPRSSDITQGNWLPNRDIKAANKHTIICQLMVLFPTVRSLYGPFDGLVQGCVISTTNELGTPQSCTTTMICKMHQPGSSSFQYAAACLVETSSDVLKNRSCPGQLVCGGGPGRNISIHGQHMTAYACHPADNSTAEDYDGMKESGDGRTGPPEHGHMGPPEHGRMGPPEHGRVGPSEHGRVGPSEHGHMEPPEHGRMGPSEHGHMGPPEHGRMEPGRGRMGPPENGRMGPPEHSRMGPSDLGHMGPPEHGRMEPGRGRMGPPEHGRMGPEHGRMGPSDHGHMGPPEHGRMRPESGRMGPPEHGRMGPPEHGPMGPSEHEHMGPPEHGRMGPPEHDRRGPEHGRIGPEYGPMGPEHSRMGPPEHGRMGPAEHGRRGHEHGSMGPEHGRMGPPEDGHLGPPEHGRMGPPQHGRMGPPEDGRMGPPEHGRMGPPEEGRMGPPEQGRMGPGRDHMGHPQRAHMTHEHEHMGPKHRMGMPEHDYMGPPQLGHMGLQYGGMRQGRLVRPGHGELGAVEYTSEREMDDTDTDNTLWWRSHQDLMDNGASTQMSSGRYDGLAERLNGLKRDVPDPLESTETIPIAAAQFRPPMAHQESTRKSKKEGRGPLRGGRAGARRLDLSPPSRRQVPSVERRGGQRGVRAAEAALNGVRARRAARATGNWIKPWDD